VVGLKFGNSTIKLMELTAAEGSEPVPEGVEVDSMTGSAHYFTVHVLNAEEIQRDCEAMGLTVVVPFSQFRSAREGDPSCFYVIVLDPDGNSVEFSQGSPWVAPTSELAAMWAHPK
jgi:hypothetical protein